MQEFPDIGGIYVTQKRMCLFLAQSMLKIRVVFLSDIFQHLGTLLSVLFT